MTIHVRHAVLEFFNVINNNKEWYNNHWSWSQGGYCHSWGLFVPLKNPCMGIWIQWTGMVEWNCGMVSKIYSPRGHLLITTTSRQTKTTFNKDHTTLFLNCMVGPISMPQTTFKKDHLFIKTSYLMFKLLSYCLACTLMMSNSAPCGPEKCRFSN